MLPHVDGQQGPLAVAQRRVGVVGVDDLQAVGSGDQPRPAGREVPHRSRGEVAVERVQRAEAPFQSGQQLAGGRVDTIRAHRLPVEGVVPGLGRTVEQRRRHVGGDHDLLQRGIGLRRPGDGSVDAGHISGVMAAVVEAHGPLGDVGREPIEGVGEGGMLDSHRRHALFWGGIGGEDSNIRRTGDQPATTGGQPANRLVGRPTASTSAANSAPELDSPSVSTPAIEAAAVVM